MTTPDGSDGLVVNQQVVPDQTVGEREPAPRRKAYYPGDKRHVTDQQSWVGPDRRGILWRPCHAEYDEALDRTLVVFSPVPRQEVERVPGLVDRLQVLQQKQAAADGAFAQIGGQWWTT